MIERPVTTRFARVRWRIFSMVLGFAIVVYFQQRSLTIAAERIRSELALSQMQIGWLQWAFVLSYGVLQIRRLLRPTHWSTRHARLARELALDRRQGRCGSARRKPWQPLES